MKEQIEKGYETGVNFYNDYIERQALFTGKIIDAGIDNAKKMSECKSIDQAFDAQVSHYKNIWKEYQTNGNENAQAFDKMQAELARLYKTAKPVAETKPVAAKPEVKPAVAKAEPAETKPASEGEPVAKSKPAATQKKKPVADAKTAVKPKTNPSVAANKSTAKKTVPGKK